MSESATSPVSTEQNSIAFAEAVKFWLKLGFISFGGPAGQISMMHQELVERRHWISERRFLHALNYTMLLPGPEAQQLATYIGWLFHGIVGGLLAGLLFVLPSFFILCSLAWVYLEHGDVLLVQGVLYGIKPAVTAIVLFAAYRIGKRALQGPLHWVIAVAALLAIAVGKIGFPYIVLCAAVVGLVAGRIKPELFSESDDHSPGSGGERHVSVIDDDTPTPEHARFNVRRLLTLSLIALGLWVLLMAALSILFGWQSTLTQMGWFFTKAALVTFGGAYAVLPYVYQGGVETYGWLSATQMIDGLALGETTPGPLIMVVTFVGFVGGWTSSVFGGDSALMAAIVAAIITTIVTFLPSFLFILAGAPFVETTRDNLKFTAPLAAITAAVVGVIINLALFFAYHTLWPEGLEGSFEWPALVLGIVAFVALIRFRIGVITLILLAGVAGACIQWLL